MYRAVSKDGSNQPFIVKIYEDMHTVMDAFQSPSHKAKQDHAALIGLKNFLAKSSIFSVVNTIRREGNLLYLEDTQGESVQIVSENESSPGEGDKVYLAYTDKIFMLERYIRKQKPERAKVVEVTDTKNDFGTSNDFISFYVTGADGVQHFYSIHAGQIIVTPKTGNMTIVDWVQSGFYRPSSSTFKGLPGLSHSPFGCYH